MLDNHAEACRYVFMFCKAVNAYFAKHEKTEIITPDLFEYLIQIVEPSSYQKTHVAVSSFVRAAVAIKLPHRRLTMSVYGNALIAHHKDPGFKAWVAATE